MRLDGRFQRVGRAVVQVGGGVPGVPQAGGDQTGQGFALHLAAGRLQRADVVTGQPVTPQVGIAVAGGAALAGKQ